MKRKHDFEDNLYMIWIRRLYCLLSGGLLFSFTMLPLVFVVLTCAIVPENLVWFVLASCPLGVAWIALMAFLDQFWEQGDVEPVKAYAKAIKTFWRVGLSYWLLTVLIFGICMTDLFFLSQTRYFLWLSPSFLLLSGAVIGLFLNLCYFQIRNPGSTFKEVLRISLYYLLRKWYVTLINTILFLSLFIGMFLKPQFGFVLLPEAMGLLLLLNLKQLHRGQSRSEFN